MPELPTIVQYLKYWTKKRGDAPAFIFRDKWHERYVLTWNKLYTLSGRFAAVLHDWGLTRGHLVANTLPNSPERVVCDVGILMSGATSVNTQCLLADGSDLLRTLSVSRASAVVVDPDVANSPWNALKGHVSLDGDGNSVTSESLPELRKVYFVRRAEDNSAEDFRSSLQVHKDWFEASDVTSNDVMTVMSTSGSTGFSKLVPTTHTHYRSVTNCFQDSDDDRAIMFNVSPLGWQGGHVAINLTSGSTRVLCDVRAGGLPEDMAEFTWRCLQEEKCTIAFLIPVIMPRLAELASGSAPVDRQNFETGAKQNDERGLLTMKTPSGGSEISTRAGTGTVAEERGDSDCARTPEERYVVKEREPENEDEDNAQQRDEPKPGTAGNGTLEAQRQRSADDASGVISASATRKLDCIFTGSMPVTRSSVEAALVLADVVAVIYGSVDYGLLARRTVRRGEDYVDYDNGLALTGVELKVVSREDEDVDVPANQMGHILARNKAARRGYLNDPQSSAAAFTKDGYFRTGDMGRLDDRGHLIVEGRGGDAIMRGAYIFYPGWLEARIYACPGVDSVLVVGVPDPDLHEELCACVVLASGDVTLTQVREFVEKDIVTKEDDPLSPRPRYYLKFESFPKTMTDKLNRKATKKMAAEMLCLSDSI